METITFSLSLNTKTKFFSMLLSDTWRNVENAVKLFNILKIETRDKAKKYYLQKWWFSYGKSFFADTVWRRRTQ